MASATAGTRSPDARSDCWVEARLTATGQAPELRIQSKVQALYGRHMRAEVADLLNRLNARDVSLSIEDRGALPYVLRARVEAAVQRLRGRAVASTGTPTRTLSAQSLRRARLYLPGNTPKFFVNAALHQPDVVVLDLEDSVLSDEKDAARMLVRYALAEVDFGVTERWVRVNAGEAGRQEITELAPFGVNAFVLPKVEHAQDVAAAHAVLQGLHRSGALRESPTLVPTVETARGVLAAPAIAAAPGVSALAIGLEDLITDLGARRTPDGRETLWARSQVIAAARAAGVQPLSSVYADVDDAEGFVRWIDQERSLGFEGVACLHPRQVAPAQRAFAPDAAEIARAQRIVHAFDAGQAQGIGAIRVDGAMIDAPVVERARRILATAGRSQNFGPLADGKATDRLNVLSDSPHGT